MGAVKEDNMEGIVVKRYKTEYIFYPDLIVIKKKGKVKHEIRIEDIERITYHPKFKISDIFNILLMMSSASGGEFFPQSLVMVPKKTGGRIWGFKIPNEDFEKIEKTFLLHIEII